MRLTILCAACNLINNGMKQFIISSETDAIREAEERVRYTNHIMVQLANVLWYLNFIAMLTQRPRSLQHNVCCCLHTFLNICFPCLDKTPVKLLTHPTANSVSNSLISVFLKQCSRCELYNGLVKLKMLLLHF